MTRPSLILVVPVMPLRHLPDGERDVLRRFFTQYVRGADALNDKRWRRFARELFNADAGEGFQLSRYEDRSANFHARHRAILQRLFDAQDAYEDLDRLHDWLKEGAGFVEFKPGIDHQLVAVPRSTAFEKCSEDEMRELHEAAVAFLHTEHAQEFLWPHLQPERRLAMLEAALLHHEGDDT